MDAQAQRIVYSMVEVALQLGCSTETVRRMVKRGDLPSVQVGKSKRIPADALRALCGAGLHEVA